MRLGHHERVPSHVILNRHRGGEVVSAASERRLDHRASLVDRRILVAAVIHLSGLLMF